ncbi:MAG: hypothetical protein U0234_04445 [Sandaracinus sp.]
MFTVERHVGRLIEARIDALATRADADVYSTALGKVVLAASDARPVLCADHRRVSVYSQPVSDRLAELFAQMNSRLDRVAILVAPTNATLFMQLQRIVREAGFASRRVFTDAPSARAFLGEVFDPLERARLDAFLASV